MAQKRSGLKIALIIIGVCLGLGLLTVLLCVGSGVYWFNKNAPEMRETGQRANDEALAFAPGHTQSDCIDEGFRKHDACGAGMAIMCRAETRIFLRRCMELATETPGVCDGVPGPTEIMPGARWSMEYCRERGHGADQQCGNFVRGVIEYCGSRP